MTTEKTLPLRQPTNFWYKLMFKIDNITEKMGRFIAYFSLLMVVLTVLIVILRYAFDLGWIAMQESVLYLHAIVFMLGAAYTLKEDGHVRVDIFYQNMSVKNQAKINLIGTLLLLIPFSFFMLFICFDYVAQSWGIQEKSAEAGGLAFVYLNKSLLLLMPITLLLQAFAEIIRQSLVLKEHRVLSNAPSSQQVKI